MTPGTLRADSLPFGWVEISDGALQRLRRELEQKGQGVVDEMGVLSIHAGYADYFFPGTSVLQTRPRYLFFVCWNFLWLARQHGVTAANLPKWKDEADLWVTRQLITTSDRPSRLGTAHPDMFGIVGVRVFREDPLRLPAQRVDFIYWTALRRWGLYRSRLAHDRTRFFRRWRGASVRRADEAPDESKDDVVRNEPLAEFFVPAVPVDWQDDDAPGLDFELTATEARWLQERLLALDDVPEGPRLLAKAAELCAETLPLMSEDQEEPTALRPWNDPLAIRAAEAAGQRDRLQRASQASRLAHYIRSIYAALVEWVVETTGSPPRNPPLRHYRDLLSRLAEDKVMRDAAVALSLPALYSDVPGVPELLRRVLRHVQEGLALVASGQDPEKAFMNEETHRLFEAVERRRKGGRARLPRTEQAAGRRIDFEASTIGVYDLDYRWGRVRYLLWDLHHGLSRK